MFFLLPVTLQKARHDEPTIRFVSIALDYVGLGNELFATLNDQRYMNEELSFLAKKSGYEYEEYLFRQEGVKSHEELSYLYVKEVGGEAVVSTIEFNDSVEAVNLVVAESTGEGRVEYERGIYMKFPLDAQIEYELESGDVCSFSKADILDMQEYVDAKAALNDYAVSYSNENITLNGNPYVSSDINELYDFIDVVSSMYDIATDVYFDTINSDEYANGKYKYRYKYAGLYFLLEDKLSEIKEIAKDSDITIFQYSGHGRSDFDVMYGGALYFNEGDFIYPYELKDLLSEIPGKKLVMLDACYSGAHTAGSFEIPDTFTEALDTALSVSIAVDDGIWTLAASRYDEVAYDGGEGCCGIFTGSLLKALGAEMERMENGGLKYISPGLPGTNSIWISELLDSTRKDINRFRSLDMQYPTGDSILDLKLFDNLK